MDLRYDEAKEDLAVRIEAHQKYSSLKIEDVLTEFLQRRRPARVLDAGCGSGNYSPLFARSCALYAGMDKNEDLLAQAEAKCRAEGLSNTLFFRVDLDAEFPFRPGSFDFAFYGYSSYYASDTGALLDKTHRLLDAKGTLCLVGPMAGNGKELDTITETLMGRKSEEKKEVRTQRLENEFLPLMRERFSRVDVVRKDFSVRFPSVAEYKRYYLATPQYKELARKTGAPDANRVEKIIEALGDLTLSKKSIFLWAETA